MSKAIVTDSVRAYLTEISRYPLLTGDQEIELSRIVMLGSTETATPEQKKARIAARNKLVRHNLRLVVSIAKKYQNNSVDLLDLIQEGAIGLNRAAELFDATKGYKFGTYSYAWIQQGVSRAIAQYGRTIRIPVHTVEKLTKIKKSVAKLSRSGKTPSLEEIAIDLDTTVDVIQTLLNSTKNCVSINVKVGGEKDSELLDSVRSSEESPEDFVYRSELKKRFDELIDSNFSARDAAIFRMKSGLDGSPDMTMNAVSEVFELSRERTRQICAKAYRRLRSESTRNTLKQYL